MNCTVCGMELRPGSRFCTGCGATRSDADAGAPPAAAPTDPARDHLQLIPVLLVNFAIPLLAWDALALPGQLLGGWIPQGNCKGLVAQTATMFVCSMMVALLTVLGPIAVVVAMFLARHALARMIQGVVNFFPQELRPILGSAAATIIFTLAWAGIHQTDNESMGKNAIGLIPQWMVPGCVGLFSYGVTRFGAHIHALFGGFFDLRDQAPVALRYLTALSVPMAFSLWITHGETWVTAPVRKEQLTVLVSLIAGFLLVSHRIGQTASSMRRQLPP